MKNFLTIIIIVILGFIGYRYFKNNETTIVDAPDIQTENQQDNAKRISTAEIAASSESKPGDVYVTLENGTTRKVAMAVAFDNDNFTEVATYRETFISQNKKFLAIQGVGFEESFVHIYDVQTNILHEKVYGVFTEWKADGNLEIESCNLAGENCSVKESTDAKKPWEVITTEKSEPERKIETIRSEFNSEMDFLTSIRNTDELSTFAAAIDSADDFIKGTGPFTVFAPTNKAFSQLPQGELDRLLQPENKEELQGILKNHFLGGEHVYTEFTDGSEFTTIENKKNTFMRQSGSVKINDTAYIIEADIQSSNGIVHIVDMVISN